MSKEKLKFSVEFDLAEDGIEVFGKFCKALIEGGFEEAVREMAQQLADEAKRRNIPFAYDPQEVSQ